MFWGPLQFSKEMFNFRYCPLFCRKVYGWSHPWFSREMFEVRLPLF